MCNVQRSSDGSSDVSTGAGGRVSVDRFLPAMSACAHAELQLRDKSAVGIRPCSMLQLR
jgi:hypothetical protein